KSDGLRKRNPSSPFQQPGYLTEGRIAAEQFVPAQSRKRHLEALLCSGPAHQKGVQPIDRWLIHASEKIIEQLLKFVPTDSHRCMFTAQHPCGRFGKRGFIVWRARVLVESPRHLPQP